MKSKVFIICALTLLLDAGQLKADDNLKLWYTSPARADVPDSTDPWQDDRQWLSGLPLGNGALGAVVFGDVSEERIQLNEETMWSGSCQDSDNPDAAKHIDEIRRLLNEGKYKEASALTDRTQVCRGKGSGLGNGANTQFGCFQTLGDLWIDFDNDRPYTGYKRELDLNTATAKITYSQDGVRYSREVFVSAPDQVMVIRLTADRGGKMSFRCRMNRPERYSTHTEKGQLIMSGSLSDGKGGDGLRYMVRLCAVAKGGETACSDSLLTIKEADEVVLLLAASTDYMPDYPLYKGRDYVGLTYRSIDKARGKSYEELKGAHIKEYSEYFRRASLEISDEPDTISTDKLVESAAKGNISPRLYDLMFQYGRYLLISSSRPGTMPANLQGIWANKIQTPWNGDYHTDVNVEMNYWPAEVTNLPEMHLPLFDLIASLAEPGTKTAHVQYGKRGWVVHPITNIWGYTSPGESASWGMHTGAPAWICQHIGEHYRYTGDKKFLRRMYPVLRGAVEFYMEWLCKDPKTGKLVSGPAVSPENTFIAPDGSKCQISMGPTHDQQTIWQLFDDFGMISEAIGVADSFVTAVDEAKNMLAETKIGSDGRIMEWAEEFGEAEPGHRHISHLFAVYPGSQINMLQTPELAKAASKSMDYRMAHGGGHTGWSSAWLISQYARLQRAEKAKESLDKILTKSINPNLFTECPPFQIDANLGTTAGMAEMLLQSHVYSEGCHVIQLLPALPAAWVKGRLEGFKARGGFEVDAWWDKGKLKKVRIKSLLGNKCRVMYGSKILKEGIIEKGKSWTMKM